MDEIFIWTFYLNHFFFFLSFDRPFIVFEFHYHQLRVFSPSLTLGRSRILIFLIVLQIEILDRGVLFWIIFLHKILKSVLLDSHSRSIILDMISFAERSHYFASSFFSFNSFKVLHRWRKAKVLCIIFFLEFRNRSRNFSWRSNDFLFFRTQTVYCTILTVNDYRHISKLMSKILVVNMSLYT